MGFKWIGRSSFIYLFGLLLGVSLLNVSREDLKGYVFVSVVAIFTIVLTVVVFGGAYYTNVSPSAEASVEMVEGEEGVYDVTVVVPNSSASVVVVEGDVERRVIEEGEGEKFRVSISEGESFRIVEYYNPDAPVLSEYFSNEYLLFDSGEE